MKKNLPLVLVILVFAGYIGFTMFRKPAPTPDVFAASITLEEAHAQSAQNGKPILVLATADWCPPCQGLKRGALMDARVVEFIEQRMIPVYLEDGTNREELAKLPLNSYPTTFIFKDGKVTSSIKGGKSAGNYLAALEKAVMPEG